MAQNTDMAGVFGDFFVDLTVKASHRRHGAERMDPSTPGSKGVEGGRPGELTARNNGQRRERSAYHKRIVQG